MAVALRGDFFIPDLCATRPVVMMVLVSQLLVLVFTLASSSLPAFNWNLLAISSLFVQWLVLCSAACICLLRGLLSGSSVLAATLSALVVVLLVTLVSSYLALWLFPGVFGLGHTGGWVLRNLLVAAVLASLVLRYFFLQQQLRSREQSELQARLDSLQARIRPHFLFNTMNSIASLIAVKPEAAERVVEDLSELFRASLQEPSNHGTVADELHLCDLYLAIEQVRLGERLQVERDIDRQLDTTMMPSLILQPLIENAVYHGVSRLPGGGTVTLRLERRGNALRAEVRNPVLQDGTAVSGHQIALSNIEQRLLGLFGDDASLHARSEGGEFVATLIYPLTDALD